MPIMKDGIKFQPPVNRRGAEKTKKAAVVTVHETTTIKGDEKMTAKKAATKKPKPQGTPKQLKKARMDAGLSIYSLADRMKVSPSTISYWENGIKHPRHDKIMKLEDIFNTNYRELFTDLSEEEARELRDKVNTPME